MSTEKYYDQFEEAEKKIRELTEESKRLIDEAERRFIREKNGVSVKDIMVSMDITRRQANYTIEKMSEQGLIEKDSDGLWRA